MICFLGSDFLGISTMRLLDVIQMSGSFYKRLLVVTFGDNASFSLIAWEPSMGRLKRGVKNKSEKKPPCMLSYTKNAAPLEYREEKKFLSESYHFARTREFLKEFHKDFDFYFLIKFYHI